MNVHYHQTTLMTSGAAAQFLRALADYVEYEGITLEAATTIGVTGDENQVILSASRDQAPYLVGITEVILNDLNKKA